MPYLSVSASTTSIVWTISGLSNEWNSTRYSSAYIKVYRNGSLVGTSAPAYPPTNGTGYSVSGSFSGLVAGTSYTADSFAVAKNGIAYPAGSTSFTTATPPDTTPPTIPSLSLVSQTVNSLMVYATSSDSGSGLNGFQFRLNGGSNTTVYQTNGGAYYTFSNLAPNTNYSIDVRAFDRALNYSAYCAARTFKTLAARPQDYNFSPYVSSGNSTSQLSATQWNAFTARINQFRIYKQLSTTTFTSATSGGVITAAMFNQARNAINAMSPSIAVPASQSAGNIAYASLFTGLTRSLNSL